MGLGVVSVVLGGLRNLLLGRVPPVADWDASSALVPPGYGSFVVVSLLASGGAGLLVALLSQTGLAPALAWYGACGAAYGCALWTLAHHGYLPFPEPE